MGYRVAVRQLPEPLDVEMGQSILAAAQAAGFTYPCGCESGNCGACKSQLLVGEVEMSPYSEFALTDAEKEAGLVLACRAVPWSDCEIAWLEADEVVVHPLRHLDCTVSALADLTHDIKQVRLRIQAGGPYTFTAGQYANVTFAGLPGRDFSMANAPDEAELEFHIRLLDGGAVSPFVARELKLGDAVQVKGPFGVANLREAHQGPIIALAGGSGLAPIKCIVERALALDPARRIDLYFGARAERDLYLVDHFTALAARHPHVRFTPVLSQPDGATARRTGFLGDVLRDAPLQLEGAKAYLAGPPVMVETCIAALVGRGLARTDCHADAFYTEAEKAKLGSAA